MNKKVLQLVINGLLMSAGMLGLLGLVGVTYFVGYVKGANDASYKAQEELTTYLSTVSSATYASPTPTPVSTTQPKNTQKPAMGTATLDWGGPQLWEAVNKRRVELGVNALGQRSELCTIASIRLNELLELGKLDGHEGFSNLPERRPDLKPIFEKYNMSEFLVSGADSAQHAVSLWENTLGHKKLLTGGEYVWGCIYAQNSFGVAIAAY